MTYISAALRREVIARAGNCCEYCRLSQEDRFWRFPIDHVIAEKHGGETSSHNLCLSCLECNTFKGSDIGSEDPKTGHLTRLFNPRQQKWDEHFQFDGAFIEGLSPEGRVTVFLLRLNQPERVEDRGELLSVGRYPC